MRERDPSITKPPHSVWFTSNRPRRLQCCEGTKLTRTLSPIRSVSHQPSPRTGSGSSLPNPTPVSTGAPAPDAVEHRPAQHHRRGVRAAAVEVLEPGHLTNSNSTLPRRRPGHFPVLARGLVAQPGPGSARHGGTVQPSGLGEIACSCVP